MPFGLRIHRGSVGYLGNAVIAVRELLVNFCVIDGVLLELRRWPRKHPNVMATSGLRFRLGLCPDLLDGNVINDHRSVVLAAPLSSHALKPHVELGQEMGPFGNFQDPLAGLASLREREKGTDTVSYQPQALPSSNPLLSLTEHPLTCPRKCDRPRLAVTTHRGLANLVYQEPLFLLASREEAGRL